MKKLRLTYGLLFLLVFMLIFLILPRSYFSYPDPMAIFYWIMAPAKWGHEHMDFLGLVRSGSLINTPLYLLGFNFLDLRYFCLFFLLTSGLIAYWGWIKNPSWKDILCPIFILLSLLSLGAYYRFLLNYYSVPPIFLAMGLGFWWKALRQEKYLWMIVSAVCFLLVAIGTLVSLITMLMGVILLGLAQWRRKQAWVLVFLSFILILTWVWFYYFHWGVAHQIHDEGLFYIFEYQGSVLIYDGLFLFELLGFFGLAFLMVMMVLNLFQKPGQIIFLKSFYLLAWVGLIFLTISQIFSTTCQFFLAHDGIFFISLMMFSVWGLAYKNLEPEYQRTYFVILLIILGFEMPIRATSTGDGLIFLYLPLVFMWQLALMREVPLIFIQWRYFNLIKYLGMALIGGVVLWMNLFYFSPIRISILDNQMASPFGIKINSKEAAFFEEIKRTYVQEGCENKALLALYDLPVVYVLTGREAMGDSAWLLSANNLPASNKTTGQALVDDLKKAGHFCVYYKAPPLGYEEKRLHRNLVPEYANAQANQQIKLIHGDSFDGNNRVILWVK